MTRAVTRVEGRMELIEAAAESCDQDWVSKRSRWDDEQLTDDPVTSARPTVTLQVRPFSLTSFTRQATSCPTSSRVGWRRLASLKGRNEVREGRPRERM